MGSFSFSMEGATAVALVVVFGTGVNDVPPPDPAEDTVVHARIENVPSPSSRDDSAVPPPPPPTTPSTPKTARKQSLSSTWTP